MKTSVFTQLMNIFRIAKLAITMIWVGLFNIKYISFGLKIYFLVAFKSMIQIFLSFLIIFLCICASRSIRIRFSNSQYLESF